MMKMQGNWMTKSAAFLMLAVVGWFGYWLSSLIIPTPWAYLGALAPFLLLYLLGTLATKLEKKS